MAHDSGGSNRTCEVRAGPVGPIRFRYEIDHGALKIASKALQLWRPKVAVPHGRKLTPRMVNEADRIQLQVVTNSTTMPHAAAVCPHGLASAEGITNAAVVRRVGTSLQVVGKVRKRYLKGGTQGLHDELRPARPRTYDAKRVAGVIQSGLQDQPPTPPTGAPTAWVRSQFRVLLVPPVRRQPAPDQDLHAVHGSLLHRESPRYCRALRQSAGSRDGALRRSETQIQALERIQPKLPIDLGYAEGYTHDYLRHGTTTGGVACASW